MSHTEVAQVFESNVFTFIEADIRREVNLARLRAACDHCGTSPGGGNFLAALGLLAYTEFLGSFVTGKFGSRWARRNFEAFYGRLGPEYVKFGETLNVYDVFRCGMVHEYTVKHSTTIAMLRGAESCGVGRQPDGRLFFVVEHYLDDFMTAARALYDSLIALEAPRLPEKT